MGLECLPTRRDGICEEKGLHDLWASTSLKG